MAKTEVAHKNLTRARHCIVQQVISKRRGKQFYGWDWVYLKLGLGIGWVQANAAEPMKSMGEKTRSNSNHSSFECLFLGWPIRINWLKERKLSKKLTTKST
jgi:hypothetical protein